MHQALNSLAAGHPLIDIDLTVFVQFGLFLLLFVVANKLLFQPYLALRERRKAGIETFDQLGDRLRLVAGRPVRSDQLEAFVVALCGLHCIHPLIIGWQRLHDAAAPS